MSLWTKIGAALSSGYTHIKTWVAPEVDAAEAALSELKAEVAKNGPQLVYDVCVAALSTVAAPGMTTGELIHAAANAAITVLKAEGLSDITATAYGTVAAALLKMHDSASKAGIAVAPTPAPTPAAA